MSEPIKALLTQLTPEIILVATACFLLLLGCSSREAARRLAPVVALIAVGIAFIIQIPRHGDSFTDNQWHQIALDPLAHFFRLIALGVALPLILLAWPTNDDATGGKGIDFGRDVPEFFALMLLAIAGILLVTAANDIILLFLGIELASIPTYIMVATSRPIPAAQEAGVKYFFLGAMAAAVLLFGLSYLYGTTGSIRLDEISDVFKGGNVTSFQMLALLMLIAGFAFKIAAVPMHAYAGDVYQGAATPVTAFLSFVPKATGFVALIKILWVAGGESWAVPSQIVTLVVVLAAITMTVGNALGLLQSNIKRVFAYSSIAHTGYMLVGVAALLKAGNETLQTQALSGVLFYLTAYGIMNAGAFGVLMLLPSRNPRPATTAETFDDIAGLGRHHVGLGLAMAACCFSLTGIPLTVGFLGKYFLLEPALSAPGLKWLAILLVINAAISAGYYLRIVGTMFLKSDAPGADLEEPAPVSIPAPVGVAIGLSVVGTILLGVYFKGVTQLHDFARAAVPPTPVSTVTAAK